MINKLLHILITAFLVITSTQALSKPPTDNPPPIEVDVFVVNDEANPVPVREVKEPTKLSQFHFRCSLLDVGDRACYSNLSDEITLPPDQRFVIQYLNATISSFGDDANPRDFTWSIGYGTDGVQFATVATKRDFLGDQRFIGNESVLLLVDEFTGIDNALPQFSCLADRRNLAGERFGCSFTATGYFSPK
jgi:hypothetical protein